ncbi:ribonuclease H-like domain-containing protein [Tanacetum coccineum]
MGDENPIRTLGDYSKPSHEGYRNTIELPVGNNVVPLRSDTIRLVQNGCSFHGLRSEDPNQHLKDFLKLVDSLDLDASNWLERLPAGSITTWEDLTTHFLDEFFPPRRTTKLRNDILMFQQHQGESFSEVWTRFKDLLEKSLAMELIFGFKIFPSPPLVRESTFDFKSGTKNNRNIKSRHDAKNLNPQSTPQVLPSFEEYTPPVTYPKEVQETLGTPIEVEPLDETKLEDLGLNTCNQNTPFSSREVPSFYRPEPQPLLNSPSLDVSLGDVIGPEPPIKPHSSNSSRMKVIDYLTTQTPPSPYVVNSHPKGVYSYYSLGIDDPKRHYGFKPGLLGKSVSLGVDISHWEMFDDDWGLESKDISPLGEELSLFDRPNEVERGRILEAHRLEPILQQ